MKALSLLSLLLLSLVANLLSFSANCQYMERVSFDNTDSTNGYYLAIPPASNNIRGVLVFFCSFRSPESLLPETRLHNIASAANLLTVYASMGSALTADSGAIRRINTLLQHIVTKYQADTTAFALGGFDVAGTIALRYTELTYQYPTQYLIRPKAVFGVASAVDLAGVYRTSKRQIKNNFFPPETGDAHAFLDLLGTAYGDPDVHPDNYRQASPFMRENDAPGNERPGNEQYLRNVALRLYYDTDIPWQLNARRRSLYDTDIPDGSELISRLLQQGNNNAEFMPARSPGVRSNGTRTASALSIVDETGCIQWIKKALHIFDPSNPQEWTPPYTLIVPDKWRIERAYVPGPFSPHFGLRGVEDIRFPPGWGVAGAEDYWSVAYLFWLEPGQTIDAGVIQNNLKTYYDELIAGAQVRRNLHIPPGTIKPVQVTIKRLTAEPDDRETYTGTIAMYDYLGGKPIVLNYLVHLKSSPTQKNIPLFLEISPQPFTHPLWNRLKEIKQKFTPPPA
jgi:hypothetical protein